MGTFGRIAAQSLPKREPLLCVRERGAIGKSRNASRGPDIRAPYDRHSPSLSPSTSLEPGLGPCVGRAPSWSPRPSCSAPRKLHQIATDFIALGIDGSVVQLLASDGPRRVVASIPRTGPGSCRTGPLFPSRRRDSSARKSRPGDGHTVAGDANTTCQNWTSADPAGNARGGSPRRFNATWTRRNRPCDLTLRFYCAENLD